MNSNHHDLGEYDQTVWFWYFGSAITTGLGWSEGSFVPVFQTHGVLRVDRLVHGAQNVTPDLARIATGVVDAHGPALNFTPVHPFATGVLIRHLDAGGETTRLGLGEPFELDRAAGTRNYEVATLTPYGALAGVPLRYVTR